MIPDEVTGWLAENGFGPVVTSHRASGGCINAGMVLKTDSGRTFFLKVNNQTPPDMFVREAEGLASLAVPGAPRVPETFLHSAHFLLLEDLAPASRRADYWPAFGRQLASLHNHTGDRFGFHHDNYLGSTPQPNSWMEDGFDFFSEQRLLYQARLARGRGYLDREQVRGVERLATRLRERIPHQPASLIHGDLWSGNAISDQEGNPAIIDPAAHYGWAEAELAMTALFGSFPRAFYQAYEETRPLELGYPNRFPVYNLYHLLNHLNLFGSGYLGEVLSVLRRYS